MPVTVPVNAFEQVVFFHYQVGDGENPMLTPSISKHPYVSIFP
jgi:hypothetical protein